MFKYKLYANVKDYWNKCLPSGKLTKLMRNEIIKFGPLNCFKDSFVVNWH
jgi:hypothetical protein